MSAPSPSPAADGEPLLVACLCARWCRTCETYAGTLSEVRALLAAARPLARLRFAWVDIEDDADLVGDLDIENFPTLLLARADEVLFFGPVTPHAGTLERLVARALDGAATVPRDLSDDASALPRRLREHPALA